MALTLRGNGQVSSDNYGIDSDGSITATGITSNGKVGIGTSLPSSLLDVDKSQNSETNIELTNTNTGSAAQVRTKYTTDGGLFTVGKTSDAHTYSGDAYIHNVDNTNIRFATSDIERMRIDASGNITTPYQPAFAAYGSAGNTNVVTSAKILFQNIAYNRGNHYNASNSTFTAPVAGVYSFSATLMVRIQSYWYAALYVNGSNTRNTSGSIGMQSTNFPSYEEQPSHTTTLNLQAGDAVAFHIWYANTGRVDQIMGHNIFTGHLIG